MLRRHAWCLRRVRAAGHFPLMPRRVDPLNRLRALKYEAGHGDKEALERQHEKGKLTARERIQRLVDRTSFEGLDVFARHRPRNFGLRTRLRARACVV